jgi:hypothetical protein
LKTLRFAQTLAAAAVVTAVVVAAWAAWWPFDASPKPLSAYKNPSLWQMVFSDRLTLGFVRGGLAVLLLFVAVSVPALAVAGRWLRAFGTSGLTADDAQDARKTITELERQVEDLTEKLDQSTDQALRLRQERDRLRDLLVRVAQEQTRTTTPRP